MMRQAGFFTPEQELGHLEARLLRAARIVVDTSLHLGEMETEDAVSFMREHALLPLPTARSEVARYCAWPTQASAYLTGALAIEQARDRVGRRRRHAHRVPRLPRALGRTAGPARGPGHRSAPDRVGENALRRPPYGPGADSMVVAPVP